MTLQTCKSNHGFLLTQSKILIPYSTRKSSPFSDPVPAHCSPVSGPLLLVLWTHQARSASGPRLSPSHCLEHPAPRSLTWNLYSSILFYPQHPTHYLALCLCSTYRLLIDRCAQNGTAPGGDCVLGERPGDGWVDTGNSGSIVGPPSPSVFGSLLSLAKSHAGSVSS